MHIIGKENGKKANDRRKVLQELFRDEASGGEDSLSESLLELLHVLEPSTRGSTFVGKPR